MKFLPAILAFLLCPDAPAWTQDRYAEYGDPTPAEQQTLEIINRARADPRAEGARLADFVYPLPGGDITEGLTSGEAADVGPRPPLAMNGILLAVARAHSRDMWTRVYFSHENPEGRWPWDRAGAAGYHWVKMGENIAASSSGPPAWLEDLLMVDPNYPGRGHRTNLLDIDPESSVVYREVGIGFYAGPSLQDFPPDGPEGNLKDFLTQDFGRRAAGPFVLGVVYADANGNRFYDPGEGAAAVTVRLSPAEAWYARTATAGGFAFPVSARGTVTVEATGGALGSAVLRKTVALDGENVKVDFTLDEVPDTDQDGLPDVWEEKHFGGLDGNGAGDPDGDGFTNRQEMLGGSTPTDAGSKPAPEPEPVPTGRGGGTDGYGDGGSGCGSLGLELILPVLLLRLRRRRAAWTVEI